MNVELLQQIKAHILADPDAFRMDTWSCGTAHCIAGWALILTNDPVVNPNAEPWEQRTLCERDPGEKAAEILGISTEDDGDEDQDDFYDDTTSEAKRLFHVNQWPDDFESRYELSDSRIARAITAAERIDHFIATNGQE